MSTTNSDECACAHFLLLSKDYWFDKDGLIRYEPHAIIKDSDSSKKAGFSSIDAVRIVIEDKNKKPIRYALPVSLFSVEHTRERKWEEGGIFLNKTILFFNVEEYNRLDDKLDKKRYCEIKRIITEAWFDDIPFIVSIQWQDAIVNDFIVKFAYQEDQKGQSVNKERIRPPSTIPPALLLD